MSQNPYTKDYIMVFPIKNHYKGCDLVYTNVDYKWYKPCQINELKFTNWTSGDENVDDFIQKMRSKFNIPLDKVFEWIPYNQFNDIEGIGISHIAKVYSATWKDGPLNYDEDTKKYVGLHLYRKVVLKCL